MKLLSFIACLAIVGITGCASVHQAPSPDISGRRMTEVQVISAATALLPPQIGDSLHVSFKDGVWEVLFDRGVPSGSGSVVTVRDSDGKAELLNRF